MSRKKKFTHQERAILKQIQFFISEVMEEYRLKCEETDTGFKLIKRSSDPYMRYFSITSNDIFEDLRDGYYKG